MSLSLKAPRVSAGAPSNDAVTLRALRPFKFFSGEGPFDGPAHSVVDSRSTNQLQF